MGDVGAGDIADCNMPADTEELGMDEMPSFTATPSLVLQPWPVLFASSQQCRHPPSGLCLPLGLG